MDERVLILRTQTEIASAQTIVLDQTKASQAYVIKSDGAIYELQRCKHYHSSWLVGQDLISDGGVYSATPVDPVFVLLPYLERSRKRVRCSNGHLVYGSQWAIGLHSC